LEKLPELSEKLPEPSEKLPELLEKRTNLFAKRAKLFAKRAEVNQTPAEENLNSLLVPVLTAMAGQTKQEPMAHFSPLHKCVPYICRMNLFFYLCCL
jgi:hypothetical protein